MQLLKWLPSGAVLVNFRQRYIDYVCQWSFLPSQQFARNRTFHDFLGRVNPITSALFQSFDHNLDQESHHNRNTYGVGHRSVILTGQRLHVRLRVDQLLPRIVEVQPPSHPRQPNLLAYEAMILEHVLDVDPRLECLGQPRWVGP